MMEECDCLLEVSEYRSAKLQVFLFPSYDMENSLPEFSDSESSHILEITSDANTRKDNMEGATSTLYLDVKGDEFNNKVPENLNFSSHSNNIGTTNNNAQIVNPPYDGSYASPTYTESHQLDQISSLQQQHQLYGENLFETSDSYSIFHNQHPQNNSDPSKKDSCLEQFRPIQGIDEFDHGLHNIVELVESVLQSPISSPNGAIPGGQKFEDIKVDQSDALHFDVINDIKYNSENKELRR